MLPKKSSKAEIILDARMLRHSGIGTYLQGLLGEYGRHPFFQRLPLGLAVSPALLAEVNGATQSFAFRSPIYSLREQLEYPFQLGRCRLWHAPHYNVPLVKGKSRLVVTVHDLIHWIFRKEFFSRAQALYARTLFQGVVRQADRIIAVSRQTRDDLIQHFGASPDRIRVIYEGVSPEFASAPPEEEQKKILAKHSLPKRFFLYVGLLKPHKNIDRLLGVFERLRSEGRIESELVLVGRKDRNYPEGSKRLARLQTGSGIHWLERIDSRRELASLYASAQALVHPSFYEGFGLTCLEAMAVGTPVVVSQAASLPEVVGESGYYIDPYSEDSIRQALVEVEKNDLLRKELSVQGKKRAGEFSWARTAEETIKVYEEVLS